MAKTANDKNEFSKSGQVAEARELWGEDPSVLLCPKCDASKVATSRPQSGDQLHSLLWPALPYRCLRCYHRFWLKEPFFAKKARVIFWALAVLAVALVSAKVLSTLFISNEPGRQAAIEESKEGLAPRGDDLQSAIVGIDQKPLQIDSQGSDTNDATLTTIELPVSDADINAQPALTLEQQKEQVKMAKERAEIAAQQSQAKLEQMETSLAPDPLELESLAKVEVGYAIEQWRSAWASGDVQTYLRQYSPSFKPASGMATDEWEAQRVARVTPSKKINLGLSSFDMSFSDNLTKAYVEFEQAYAAGAYSETSNKQLVLLKGANGWKIVSEVELEQ